MARLSRAHPSTPLHTARASRPCPGTHASRRAVSLTAHSRGPTRPSVPQHSQPVRTACSPVFEQAALGAAVRCGAWRNGALPCGAGGSSRTRRGASPKEAQERRGVCGLIFGAGLARGPCRCRLERDHAKRATGALYDGRAPYPARRPPPLPAPPRPSLPPSPRTDFARPSCNIRAVEPKSGRAA